MLRFVGIFLFGLAMTMIFVDVIKLMCGTLRPNFYKICKPNLATCDINKFYNESICQETDKKILRNGRLSFPSMQAAVTSFSAFFLAVCCFFFSPYSFLMTVLKNYLSLTGIFKQIV